MSQLVVGGSLKEFFRMLVGEVVSRQRVSLQEITEYYVVNLLSEYAFAEKLFTPTADGKREAEPLALLYHRALQQDREEKLKTLRRLGDVSLYTAGFFGRALEDTAVGAGYYVQMGTNAYGAIADMSGASAFAAAYHELHAKFSALVQVLSEIAARGLAAQGPAGQVQLLDDWARTGDPTVEHVLADVGVLPKRGLLPS